MNSGSCEDKLSDKRRNYCELRRSQDARDRRDQSDVIRKVTARRRARRKITARRRARFNAKCKAENEMQEHNSRAGGEESNKIAAGAVPSQIIFIFICTYVIFA